MTMEMPRFDFSGATIKTDEELVAAEAGDKKKGDKYFRPGQYDVVIEDVVFQGMAAKDPNWGKLAITYKAGEKTIMDFVLIPFKDVTYGENKTLFPFKKVQNLASALGTPVTIATLGDSMKTLFGRPEKLKGRPVKIEVGYQKGYVKYNGKNAEGATTYILCDKEHNPVRDNSLNVVTFPDFDAALGYATENKIPVDRYVNVLSYTASAVAATTATAKSDW